MMILMLILMWNSVNLYAVTMFIGLFTKTVLNQLIYREPSFK